VAGAPVEGLPLTRPSNTLYRRALLSLEARRRRGLGSSLTAGTLGVKMNALEFIASIVGSLAWPGLVLTLLWLLAKHQQKALKFLEELRGFIKSAKGGPTGIEVQFRDEVVTAQKEANTMVEVATKVAEKLPAGDPNKKVLVDSANAVSNSIHVVTGTASKLVGGTYFVAAPGVVGSHIEIYDPTKEPKK
jgi:hypothetical protein